MNLKEMQLVGFKSFADKTTIPFQEGVTCIVGPNGCGKSNVADAVRWVSGELSAKSLRGSNMQDVIFNGTEKRRPLSFCEVTLTFDNSKKMFDSEYDEVAMSRRLYRSGESEYLLNGKNCRRGDLVAMLHGVGIGREGYSIIGQGRVTQIMNSKPEDRRAIFEEATGIMIQKQRKQEVERKLAASEDNLAVYKQRISEAERQLAPLARQAETARTYNELSEKLKYHEVNTYIFRHENAESEKKKFTDEMSRLNEELARYNATVMRILNEREMNRAKLNAADTHIAELNRQLLEYTTANTEKSGNAKLYKEKASAFLEKLEEAKKHAASCARRIQEIDRTVAETETAILQKRARLRGLQRNGETYREKIADLDRQIAEYDRGAMADRIKELASFDDLSQLKEGMGSLSARLEAIAERKEEINRYITAEEKRRVELQTEWALHKGKIRELEDFVSSEDSIIAAQNDAIRAAREKCDRINGDIYRCQARIDALNNTRDVYVGLKNNFDGYRESVRRLLLAGQRSPEIGRRMRGVVADIISCDQKYELAIETIIGGAMQNVVTATGEDARDLITYLKRNGMGVVTFLPVDSMKSRANSREAERALSENGALGLADQIVKYDKYYSSVVKNLLGNTLVCDNNDNALRIAKKYSHAFRIVTLEGDVIATSGAMTGGSRKKENGNLLENDRKIKECDESIESFQKELSRLRTALAAATQERGEEENKLADLHAQIRDSAANLAAAKQQEASVQQLLGEVEEKITLYHNTLNVLKEKEKALSGEAKNSAEKQKELARRSESAGAEQEANRLKNQQLKEEREKYNSRYGDTQIQITSLTAAIENDEQTISRLNAEKEELQVTEATDRESAAEYEKELQRWQVEAQEQELTEEEQQKVNALRAEIENSGAEKQAINKRQEELEAVQNECSEKITSTASRHAKCEVEIGKIESNLENLRQRIDEAYQMTYEDCAPYRDAEYDITASANEIKALKGKITALGPVNANALEDYEILKTRYDEMATQRDDVEKAIADATTLLEEIKKDMRERFDEGFNKINENFSTIFRELFGGGRAELQMDYTDCVDPLEAGVEINACPPGKKLTKLSLLSGGEQALTAIAILFAIIKSNPMPFCILDEIEAALDDANVDRFARYLKKFSNETQFIVITHRKPTMNQAENLFGVTMEEKGVSKIVSVKLAEVETRLGGDTVIE